MNDANTNYRLASQLALDPVPVPPAQQEWCYEFGTEDRGTLK